MRRVLTLIVVSILLIAPSVPGVAAGEGLLFALATDVPGEWIPVSPVVRTIGPQATANHVLSVELQEGDILSLELSADVAHGDIDLYLFDPATTSVNQVIRQVAASASKDAYPEVIRYLVPPGGGGTYYVEIKLFQGLVSAMQYSLEWSVESASVAPRLHRLADTDRHSTSLAISRSTFTTATAAVLATGAGFPDALAASALAGALDAPLLLLRDDIESTAFNAVRVELERLGVKNVYVAGGASVVSDAAVDTIRNGWGFTVTRLGGANRYETGRAIADEVVRVVEARGGTVSSAFVVRGDAFADALAAGPYAFSQKMPVLLTPPGALHPLAAQFIETEDVLDITVVGGTSAVSASVASAADALNAGATGVTRVSGDNRFETAANLAQFAVSQRAWATWEYVGVATGRNFPDALSGSAAAGRRGGVLLLTAPDALSAPASQALSTNASAVRTALVFGGTGAVSGSVCDQVRSVLR